MLNVLILIATRFAMFGLGFLIGIYTLRSGLHLGKDSEPGEGGAARVYEPGEFWFESPGSHHRVSANASDTEPARLLALFIVDAADEPLTTPDPQGTNRQKGTIHVAADELFRMKALGTVYGYVRQSGLPSRLIDLVFLRVSQINGCAYCIDMHSRDLIKAGGRHLQRAGKSGARVGGRCDSARRAGRYGRRFEAAAAVFAEKQLADLTLAISMMNAYNRMAISFRATPVALTSGRGRRRPSGRGIF